jgi:hypothetical protein
MSSMTCKRGPFFGAAVLLTIVAATCADRARAHGDVDEPTHSHLHGAEGPPDDLPYVSGQPAPKGYHYENGPRRGAMIGGAVFFGIGYLPALGLAGACLGTECRGAAPGKGWETALAIPVAGPIVYAAGRCAGDHDRSCYFGTAAWILDTALQAGGIALFLHGQRKREIWIRDEASVAVVPSTVGGRGLGLALGGFF